MEVLPCARVAHIERTKKPYNNDIDYYAKRNALRAAEVWMDEYKSHVYMAWNIPMNVRASSSSSSLRPATPTTPQPAHSLACSCRRAAPSILPGPESMEKFEIQILSHLTFTPGPAERQKAGWGGWAVGVWGRLGMRIASSKQIKEVQQGRRTRGALLPNQFVFTHITLA